MTIRPLMTHRPLAARRTTARERGGRGRLAVRTLPALLPAFPQPGRACGEHDRGAGNGFHLTPQVM